MRVSSAPPFFQHLSDAGSCDTTRIVRVLTDTPPLDRQASRAINALTSLAICVGEHLSRKDFMISSPRCQSGPPNNPSHPVSVAPDGTWLVYAQVDSTESDLMLIEGFQ